MKKVFNAAKKYLLPTYAALLSLAAMYVGFLVYNEEILVLSAEQVNAIQMQFQMLYNAYRSCKAGA